MPLYYILEQMNQMFLDGYLRLVSKKDGMVEVYAGVYQLQVVVQPLDGYRCRMYKNGEYKSTQVDMCSAELVDLFHDITDHVYLVDYANC